MSENSETTPAIRVLIADDDPIVREGLNSLISFQPDMSVIASAGNGAEAIRMFRTMRPDVAIIDLQMPSMGGLEATAAIRREFPNSRIVVLTSYGRDEDIYRALQSGARAYLLKGCELDELVAAIRIVHSGGRYVPPQVSSVLANRISASVLTSREQEILERIVLGYSNRSIAASLGVSESTVKGHITHLLEKLGVSDRTQAATAAIQRGFVHLGDRSF